MYYFQLQGPYISYIQVLQYGTPLLSSTGDEFSQLEEDPDYQKMSTQVLHLYRDYKFYCVLRKRHRFIDNN